MIIDNFLPLPRVVRHWAASQKYYNAKEYTEMYNKHTDWPGKRTLHVTDLDPEYANFTLNKVASIVNRCYDVYNLSIKSYFQLTIEDDGDSWVHQDNDTDIAGILYLNPNPPENSGTTLYHCNDVNSWQAYMATQEGYNTLKTINRIDNETLYKELFQPIDVISNVFNRLILYPGTAYHKSNDYFGKDITDGRLTQVFFVKNNV